MILAAGMGSRYGGLKQVDALGPHGEAIIEYSVFDAIRAGFGKVVFIIRKSIEDAFREKIGDKFNGKIEVEYAFQETDTPIDGIDQFPPREKPWGTAHAMLVARQLIREPFAVINADDYYGISSFVSMRKFLEEECTPDHFSMIGYQLNNTLSDHGHVNRGVCEVDASGNLTTVVERHKIRRTPEGIFCEEADGSRLKLPDDAPVSMNFWGFHPAIFEIIRKDFIRFVEEHADDPRAEFNIPLVINRLINEKMIDLTVIPNDEHWYGVTYQEDKPMVLEAFAQLTREGKYPPRLWS